MLKHGTSFLPSRRFRRDIGCFLFEKSLKLTPKMTKVPKYSTHFSSNDRDFVDWNVLRGQQGKRWLSKNHVKEFIAFF